ncbi:MAG TPA: energy transducer TonB [Gemmatimonadales bacterium]|jgi:TonB family protein
MRLTLLESDKSLFRSAEYATMSIVAHATVLWLAVATTMGAFRLPVDEREAKVMFLLPPDRVESSNREVELRLPGRPGSGLDQAGQLPSEGEGRRLVATASRGQSEGERSGARGEEPFGPAPFLAEKVYSALQVDQMVERYEFSAAPVYPPELSARGKEGKVDATFVVDAGGQVDTTTIHVMESDDSLFTESVRTSLGEARFRPAMRGGKSVRQLVQQRFSFRLSQSSPVAH